MPAYMVAMNKILDEKPFWDGYASRSLRLVPKFGGKYRILDMGAALLEGSEEMAGASLVIIEFPDMAAIERFWQSPEYAEIKTARQGISLLQAFATDASWMDDTQSDDVVSELLSAYA